MTDLFSFLRPIIMRVTGVEECVKANTSAISVKGEYASVLISQTISPQSKGFLRQKLSEDKREVLLTTVYPVVYEVTVNFWRGEAIKKASKLLRMQYLPSVEDAFFREGISLADCSQVINLTALQSQSFEERAVVTLTIVGLESVSESVNTILEIPSEIEDEKGRTLVKIDTKDVK